MIFADIFGLMEKVQGLLIDMVAGLYHLVDWSYQIFLVLAKTNIFKQDDYIALTNKVYVILGVLTMFIIAYNILNFIIDPDKNKGGSAVETLIKKIVTSFILIVLCPTLFNLAFDIQSAILNQGIFTKFFSNKEGFSGNNSIEEGGKIMATYAFTAFFAPSNGDENTKSQGDCQSGKPCTYEEAKLTALETGSFADFHAFAKNLADDKKTIEFNFLMALVAGGFLVYVTISFCFDLAIRVVRLAFYQIIAPICIACRIIPDKESIFTNWWKAVSKTFLSVFIRVFIMNFGVYLITIFVNAFVKGKTSLCPSCNFFVRNVAYAMVIMGIVTFIKQAAKYLDEIFGFGDVSLGIKDKLASGGAFTAGSIAGAGITTMARNATHGVSNIRKAYRETEGGKARKVGSAIVAGVRGARSVALGTVAGAARGAKAGWKAASGSDMANAARTAAAKTTEKRDAREAYRASHDAGPIKGTTPVIGHVAEAWGHIKDTGFAAGRWAGINNIEELERANSDISKLADEVSSVADAAKSMLESKAGAGKNYDFGITDGADGTKGAYAKISSKITSGNIQFSLSNIRKFKDAIAESQRTGKSVKLDILDGGVNDFNAEELSRVYGKYLSDYSKRVADIAFLSDDNYKTTIIDAKDLDEQAAIADIHTKADKARETVRSALGSSVLKTANAEAVKKGRAAIDTKTIDGDLQFSSDGALDKIKPAADIERSHNQERINEIRQKENPDKGKK